MQQMYRSAAPLSFISWLLTFALSFLASPAPSVTCSVCVSILQIAHVPLKSGLRDLHKVAYRRAGTAITLHYKLIHLLFHNIAP